MKNPKIIKLKKITSSNGKLIILEKSKKIDLNYKRFFTIFSNKKSIRGNHAHKKCYQILICLNGKIEVNCELKNKKKFTFILNKPDQALIIYPMTWCIQKYKKNNSILLVACNELFSESDYIRDYKKFLNHK
tara:strand:- start:82 stop:477 length:396 start_codon:yes stop_codon:yes gene_type:complete